MNIYSVLDKEFKPYGQVHDGFPTEEVLSALAKTPVTNGVVYTAEDAALQQLAVTEELSATVYGGMPVQMGWCNGHNTKLNCLEYHRDSELNLGTGDFILLLAKQEEVTDGKLDTAKVMAFRVPAGVLVEVYATSLHYAPCQTGSEGFQVLVVLPKGTNGAKPEQAKVYGGDDKLLWACNKWLIAHPETGEAAEGAFAGLIGENIDIAALL
ncbi:DUF4867 family protein [Butyricicoccus sp.]|uniref:DUF4867 family protein n=1 Tax=Butyricicoccus sp. TaxID=2049021 RepID=UPI003F15C4C1